MGNEKISFGGITIYKKDSPEEYAKLKARKETHDSKQEERKKRLSNPTEQDWWDAELQSKD